MKMTVRRTLTLILVSAVMLTGNCAAPGTAAQTSKTRVLSSVPSSEETATGVVYIVFEHDRFVPDSVTVPAGTTVVWQVSEDYLHHWVVCDAVPFRGWFYEWFPFQYQFTKPGVYPYYDGANPATAGTVVVS
jgi:plastocyanin